MMRKFALPSILAVLVMFPAAEAGAQDVPGTMSREQVTDLVTRVYDAPAGKFLLKQMSGPDNRGYRVVFVHNGNRYTLDHNWWMDGVQVWVRPDGTSHRNPPANALADDNTDGVVDFGTDGKIRIFAVANHYHEGSAATGVEHRRYWQNVYNEALVGLKEALR